MKDEAKVKHAEKRKQDFEEEAEKKLKRKEEKREEKRNGDMKMLATIFRKKLMLKQMKSLRTKRRALSQ